PVRNLTAGDFRLEENGSPQQIVALGDPGEARVEIALLFDITASVYDLFQFERQAALRFLQEALRPNDAISIFTIGIRPRLIRSRAVALIKLSRPRWRSSRPKSRPLSSTPCPRPLDIWARPPRRAPSAWSS